MFPSIYYPTYTRSYTLWFLRDEPKEEEKYAHKSMLFHLEAGDYITTLATILRFFEETIHDKKTTPEMRELQLKTMKDVREDLLYLDKHYTIVPKDQRTRE